MRAKNWALIFLATLILIQLSATLTSNVSAANDWPMFRHDLNHSAVTDGAPSNSATLLWNFSTGDSVWSSPAVAGGCVYAGSKDHYIYCVNASNGELVWKFPTEEEIDSSPSVDGDQLFIVSGDGWLYCMNTTTGMPIWIKWVGWNDWTWNSRSSPTVYEGKVYIGSGQNNMQCFNKSDGTLLWTWIHKYPVNTSPVISNGTMYISTDDRYLHALNASDGKEIWRSRTVSQFSSACLNNGLLYVGSYDNDVFCVNASDGAIKWRFHTGDTITSSPAVAYGCVYVGSEDNSVYCLNASNGEKVWQTPTGYWVCSSPAIASGNIYIGSEDYNMYCLKASTGAIKWSFPTGDYVDSSPAIVGNILYFGSHDNNIYALNLQPNQQQTKTEKPVFLSTIVFDAAACTIVAASVIGVLWFRKQEKKNNQTSNIPKTNAPWYKTHADAVCLLIILLFSVLFFVNFGSGILWESDEKTYTQMAVHMVQTGDYLTPYCFGELGVWTGKPPVLMWVMSLSYQVFGFTAFAARFSVDVFGALSLVLMFYLGKKLYNRWVGLASALVLGSFSTYYLFATHAMTDVPLVFFVLASLYFLILSQDTKKPLFFSCLSGAFFGLAMMTKQTEALLIPLIAIIYLALSNKSLRFLFTKQFAAFLGAAVLVFAPWVIFMSTRFGGEFWNSYFLYSTFLRASSPIEGHTGNALFYFNHIAANEPLIWVVLLPIATALCGYFAIKKHSKSDILILTWIIAVLSVFTVAQTKIYWYILPVYPAFALAIASFIFKLAEKIRFIIRPQKNT
jgi:outer membrane protein assembly factor BamB